MNINDMYMDIINDIQGLDNYTFDIPFTIREKYQKEIIKCKNSVENMSKSIEKADLVDRQKLIQIINERCCPIKIGQNQQDNGMSVADIMQAIDEAKWKGKEG